MNGDSHPHRGDWPGEPLEQLMARIGEALERHEPRPDAEVTPPVVDPDLVRLTPADTDVDAMAGQFVDRARGVGMQVDDDTARPWTERLIDRLVEAGTRRVGVAMRPGEPRNEVLAALESARIEAVLSDERGLDPMFEVDAGVTDVDAALADTGSLVIASQPGVGRGPSLAPPIHVALVRSADLLPDMVDLWANRELPATGSATAIITGPSKTADIEGVLVTGVHGPKLVHIILTD